MKRSLNVLLLLLVVSCTDSYGFVTDDELKVLVNQPIVTVECPNKPSFTYKKPHLSLLKQWILNSCDISTPEMTELKEQKERELKFRRENVVLDGLWKNISLGMDKETVRSKLEDLSLELYDKSEKSSNTSQSLYTKYDPKRKDVTNVWCVSSDVYSVIVSENYKNNHPSFYFYDNKLIMIDVSFNWSDIDKKDIMRSIKSKYGGKEIKEGVLYGEFKDYYLYYNVYQGSLHLWSPMIVKLEKDCINDKNNKLRNDSKKLF